MLEFRRSLPAYKEREALLKAISENQVNYDLLVIMIDFSCGFIPTLFSLCIHEI